MEICDVEESRIIRYPPQISFASLKGIVHSYGTFLEWKKEKEVYDNISKIDHKIEREVKLMTTLEASFTLNDSTILVPGMR